MKISISTFRGRAPRYAGRLLPEGMSQTATNPRLLSGDLEAWNDNQLVQSLAKKGSPYTDVINTIYAMDVGGASGGPFWLHWTDSELGTGAVEVDVARGPIVGDTSEVTYITGLDAPRWTNLELATDPSNQGANTQYAYPYITYKLGMPAPTVAPTLEIVPGGAAAGSVTLTNPGAESASSTGWTITTGQLEVHDDNDVPGIVPAAGLYYFYGGTAASSESYQEVDLDAEGVIAGQAVTLSWKQCNGTNNSTAKLGLRFYDSGAALLTETFSPDIAPGATWTDRSVQTIVPEGATTMRVVIVMTRVGASENDAYIDEIALALDPYSYTSNGSDLSAWEISPTSSANPGGRSVTSVEDPTASGYGSVFRFFADENTAWARKNFQLSAATFTVAYDFYAVHARVKHYLGLAVDADGAGEGISILATKVERRSFTGSNDEGVVTDELATGLSLAAKWLHVEVVGTKTTTGYDLAITVTEKSSGTELFSDTTEIAAVGDWLNLKHWSNEGGPTAISYVDNITIDVVKAVSSDDDTPVTTNYVYTWVNAPGQESAPSPVSSTITKLEDSSVTVTTPTATDPAGDSTAYGITKKRIYRAVTGDSGSQYLFVAEITLATATYSDSKSDAELGEVLDSDEFDLPPDDGRGIIAAANGITYLFSGNQLCPSAQNRPYAYPESYRLATDFPIVAIAAMDTDIIVATQANPYIVQGDDPSALSMAKIEKPQGCVSKRSMVTIAGVGVVYASPDGLTAVSRAGVSVITEGIISRKEWQALVPSSISAVEHDGRYVGFYDAGTMQAGFIFDPNPNGFGWIDLDFYPSAMYSNPLTDRLYFVISGDLYVWDTNSSKRSYTWKSKQFKLPRPASFAAADVRVSGTVTMKLFADGSGSPYLTKSITASGEFNLPDTVCQDVVEIQFEGTGTVQSVVIAESMDEVMS